MTQNFLTPSHSGDHAPQSSILNPQSLLVTILIPNYKTPEVTPLCLRLLRQYTDFNKARIIVIDNDSQDASLAYLKTLPWITLIERKPEPGDFPALAHARALDLGLTQVQTPYVLSIHTDTIVKRPDWLEVLLKPFENHPEVSSVGSWKLESKPWFERGAKWLEKQTQLLWYRSIGKQDHAIQGHGKNYYYLRSHCALYRMDLLKKYQLTFSAERENAGKVIHKKLQEYGYQSIFLPSELLGQYVDHLNHATTVLNPQLGSREKSIIKGTKRIRRALKKIGADKILQNDQLDR